MNTLEFIAEERTGVSVPEGNYLASIDNVVTKKSKLGTDQLEVTFITDEGKIKKWFNLTGYNKDDDGNFITDTDGNRTISKENTRKAHVIVANFGVDCGFEAGAKFGPQDLMGKEVGIVVGRNERNAIEVSKTFNAEELDTVESDMS